MDNVNNVVAKLFTLVWCCQSKVKSFTFQPRTSFQQVLGWVTDVYSQVLLIVHLLSRDFLSRIAVQFRYSQSPSIHVLTYQLGHIKNAALHVGIKLVEQTPPGPGDASEMFPVTQIMMSSIFVLSIGSCSLPRDNPPLKRLGNFSCLIREEKAYLQSATDNDPSLSCFHNN